MRKKEVIFYYGLDYCCRSGALYVDGVLITEDPRVGTFDLLESLGYSNIKEVQVDQQWILDRCWNFPQKASSIKINN